MTLAQIAALALLAVTIGRLRSARPLALLAVSTIVLFWLQPAEPIATLGFWLPAATLGLTTVTWVLTSAPEARSWSHSWPSALVMGTVILLAELGSLSGWSLNPAVVAPRPSLVLLGGIVLAGLLAWLWRTKVNARHLLIAVAGAILLAFVLIKTPGLTTSFTVWLQAWRPASSGVAADVPFVWLGFSYVAFRLLHTIRDRQSGRLPAVSLSEYVTYVIFFPSFTAGPIDRVERFIKELREPLPLNNEDWLDAGTRLVLGLFKKFVIADMLAVISMSDLLVENVHSAGWMWLLVYAYAFRIYFDFSGYTDMALGMARLLGVRLPENFKAPYLKQNLALFWSSWHMSLTQWFRSYVFNPLARTLRSGNVRLPTWGALLITQLVTMVLIGLWHGITWGFALWGLWHGIGLFVHNRWGELTRGFWSSLPQSPGVQRAAQVLGAVITFHFVAVGWVFFALSTPALGWRAIGLLVGAW